MTLEGSGPFSVFPTPDMGRSMLRPVGHRIGISMTGGVGNVCGSAWKGPVLVPQVDPGTEKGHYEGMISCQELITWGHS